LMLIAGYVGIQLRLSALNADIATKESKERELKSDLEKAKPLLETAQSLDDWTKREINWLDQFQIITKAMGGMSKVHLTSFDGNVVTRNALAVAVAGGRAKSIDDVEALYAHLAQQGYKVKPKEIIPDPAETEFPQRLELNLEIMDLPRSAAKVARTAATTPTKSAKPAPDVEKSASASEKENAEATASTK
jgi:hypothetical protein